jgi:two-component system response regulator AtoC
VPREKLAMTAPRVLIADSSAEGARSLGTILADEGVAYRVAQTGNAALAMIEAEAIAVVIASLRLSDMRGLELLAAVSERWLGMPVVLTGEGASAAEAMEALRAGAEDFLPTPFEHDEVAHVLGKVLALAQRRQTPPPQVPLLSRIVVGESRAMREVMQLLTRAAQGTATVLIQGETGTGKELAARALHDLGPRAARPFVKIDCTALPEALLESELFGHEKGAFTGATRRKPGRVELADGGTLFLDEIGELTAPLQAKLLRLVQEREFERLGGTATLRVDVRVVAATHRDLEAMVADRRFREDLYYRLNVVPVWMPPLRARRDDVEPLARKFAEMFAAANKRQTPDIDPTALRALRRERWHGNIRQLQNFVERLVVLYEGPTIRAEHVRAELGRHRTDYRTEPATSGDSIGEGVKHLAGASSLDAELSATEKAALVRAIEQARGNRSLAARLLGVSRSTLYARLEKYGLLPRTTV